MEKLLEAAERHIPAGYDPTLYRLRHSAAHVLAQAVIDLFPQARIAIGPPIEEGFYYDFELPRTMTPDDLESIEQRMREIIAGQHPFTVRSVSPEEAQQLFAEQPYKRELIRDLGDAPLTVYTQATFTDLCRGPHVAHTGEINPAAFKLLHVAGAYWRGDEQQPMLQRIYGTAWRTAEELEQYLWRQAEAQKRDHRVLGRQLDLFTTHEDIGAGLVLWNPKGGMIRKLIEDFWGDEHERSYEFVYTPHIGKANLWQTSGHLDFYAESMYAPMDIEGQPYYLKPMNCPFHVHIFKSQPRSYRDLPLRFAEKGTVYRYERSGTLHGLLRVRGFTQDDAHHFCRPDQMAEEINFAVNFSVNMLRAFGFTEFQAYLSTRPDKYVGDLEMWAQAEKVLEDTLIANDLPYKINPGDGAFYGAKIDITVKDALGREWQLSTIQFDFNLPERFDLTFIGADGKEHRPFMVHRALLGSIERFFGVLIEHYAGAFPVWLSPVQAVIIPITDDQVDYAYAVAAQLKAVGLRAQVDTSHNRMNNKIRLAQEQKIPYMLVVGKNELANQTVSVRLRTEENLGEMSLPDFVSRVQGVIAAKAGL